jgi:hypothetical protein
MYRILFALLLLFPGLASAATPRIGINLSPVNYWTPDQPFLDRMKERTAFAAEGPATEPLMLTPKGEPANFPAGASMVHAAVGMDSPGQTFALLYSGTATFQFTGGKVLSTAPGRVTFQWSPPDPSKVGMQIIIRSGVPADMHIVREDQVALFQAGEIFKPDWLDRFKGMSHFRAMDWLRTNGSTATDMLLTWDGSYADGHPVPLSIIVALARKTGMRPWIDLPLGIGDVGLTAALDYLKTNMPPGNIPIIEHSNEVWNTGFPQGKVALAAVTAKTGDTGYYYGQQLAHIASITRGYPVGLVAMWQFVSPGKFANVLAGFTAGGGKDSDLEAIGAANYLYGNLNDARSPIGPALLAGKDIPGALANVAAQLPGNAVLHAKWVAIAKAHGWKYWTYEGGNYHLNTLRFGTNAEPLRAFYQAVQEDPRAAPVLATEMENFAAAGGDAMTIYNLSSPSTVGGYFGIVSTPGWAMYRARLDAKVANDNELMDLRAQVQALAAKVDKALASRN